MRVKELANWVESFNLPPMPWINSDWETALNLLARILYKAFEQRFNILNKESGPLAESSIRIPFQEVMELAEYSLGLPQLVVVYDTKQSDAENKLSLFVTLCLLGFSTEGFDTKTFRDIDFAFRLYFDLDVDGNLYFCDSCSKKVPIIERIIIKRSVWHRSCLRCSIEKCSKQLHRGSFHKNLVTNKLECIEHFTNRVLCGDPMKRLFDIITSRQDVAECTMKLATPPPRPPPPKMDERIKKGETNAVNEGDYIAQQIATAASDVIDYPIDLSPAKSNANTIGDKSWEVLSYPEALNPFGSDEEDDPAMSENIEGSAEKSTPFGFESDADSPDITMDSINITGNDNTSTIVKARNSTVKINENEKGSLESVLPPESEVVTRNNSNAIPVSSSKNDQECKYEYFVPLPPMLYRLKNMHKSVSSTDKISIRSEPTIHNIEMQLRKVHSNIEQYEITGRRLETQLLRTITNTINDNKTAWKNNKILEDYAQTIERRCESFRMEAVLVKSYMNLFLNIAHTELENQMKEGSHCSSEPNSSKENSSNNQHLDLLVHLLEIKNELTSLENISLDLGKGACNIKSPREDSLLKGSVKKKLKLVKKKI